MGIKKFEYKYIRGVDVSNLERILNTHGSDGWKVMKIEDTDSINYRNIYFIKEYDCFDFNNSNTDNI